MNKLIYFFLSSYLIFQVLCVIPEWDLSEAGNDLLGSSTEVTYRIYEKNNLKMEKVIKKNRQTGEITTENYITIDNIRKKVNFEQVESSYYFFNRQIICPKGKYHPYDFTNGVEYPPKDFDEGENWDLSCYHEPDVKYLLVFYSMNGSHKNVYLTTTNANEPVWYGGISINNVEIYDYLLKFTAIDQTKNYQMMGLLKKESNIELRYLELTLQEGDKNQYFTLKNNKTIIDAGKYSQATFKHSSNNDYFYYFTYNNISDLNTGYTPNAIDTSTKSEYSSIDNIQNTKNNVPNLEFFNDMEIEEMNFLLDNKFLYYKMKEVQKNGTIYYGIFDIVLNKIIFNTKEKINTFIPLIDGVMLAITSTKAYQICTYKNGNDCTDTC